MKHRRFVRVLVMLIPMQSSLADEPLEPAPTHKIVSANPACWAISDARTHVTTAYRDGQEGEPITMWSTPGWFRVAELSSDCRYLVTGYDGGNLLPMNADGDIVMLSFYRDGRMIRRIRLGELICDRSRLERTASHLAWGDYVGAEKGFFYRIRTQDRGELVFDMRTGKVSNGPSLTCDRGGTRP